MITYYIFTISIQNHCLLRVDQFSPFLQTSNPLARTSPQVPLNLPLPVGKVLGELIHGVKVNDIQVSTNHGLKCLLTRSEYLLQLLIISLLKPPPAVSPFIEPLPLLFLLLQEWRSVIHLHASLGQHLGRLQVTSWNVLPAQGAGSQLASLSGQALSTEVAEDMATRQGDWVDRKVQAD